MNETKKGRPKRLHGVKRYSIQIDVDDAEWGKRQSEGLACSVRMALSDYRKRLSEPVDTYVEYRTASNDIGRYGPYTYTEASRVSLKCNAEGGSSPFTWLYKTGEEPTPDA